MSDIEKRRSEIVSLLYAMQKELKVEELSSILDVSPATVRRDLHILHEQNVVIRTHGGCIVDGHSALEGEYQKKVSQNFRLKNAIGKASAKEVSKNQHILIDDGSTTFHFASHLAGRGPLSVYTNSFPIISALSRFEDIELFMLGGRYNPDYSSLTGEMSERILEMFNFDHVFIGAAAIDDNGQCLASDLVQARLIQLMLRSSQSKILLADHTKINAPGRVAFGSLEDFNKWITTRGLKDSQFKKFSEMTEIITVDPH